MRPSSKPRRCKTQKYIHSTYNLSSVVEDFQSCPQAHKVILFRRNKKQISPSKMTEKSVSLCVKYIVEYLRGFKVEKKN